MTWWDAFVAWVGGLGFTVVAVVTLVISLAALATSIAGIVQRSRQHPKARIVIDWGQLLSGLPGDYPRVTVMFRNDGTATATAFRADASTVKMRGRRSLYTQDEVVPTSSWSSFTVPFRQCTAKLGRYGTNEIEAVGLNSALLRPVILLQWAGGHSTRVKVPRRLVREARSLPQAFDGDDDTD